MGFRSSEPRTMVTMSWEGQVPGAKQVSLGSLQVSLRTNSAVPGSPIFLLLELGSQLHIWCVCGGGYGLCENLTGEGHLAHAQADLASSHLCLNTLLTITQWTSELVHQMALSWQNEAVHRVCGRTCWIPGYSFLDSDLALGSRSCGQTGYQS